MIPGSEKKSIGIIGGGMLGMTLALLLAKKGFRVSLIEKSDMLGGLVAPRRIGDFTWDKFYHVILLSDGHLIDLLDRLGLKDQINWGYTKTGFFTEGQFYSMSNVKEFLLFPPLGLMDKLRLGFTIFYASKIKSSERLEEGTSLDWLTKLSGERTVNKMWAPLLRSKLGEHYELASASFIWSTIARMYAARRSGHKQEMFGYVDGGYSTILNRLQEHLNNFGVDFQVESRVTRISEENGHVTLETADGRSQEFDELVLTIPCPQISALCPQLSSSEAARLSKITYLGLICASVILRRPLGGYYYTNITDDDFPFTGIVEMTGLANNGYFGGNSLVYLPRYMTEKDPFWQESDDQIRQKFKRALQAMYPTLQDEDFRAVQISRAKQIMPVVTLNYSRDLLPATKTSLEHVFVVNSAQIVDGTWNVNEVVRLAEHKAAEIAEIVRGR
jgi:protoporphyrinogen oxidase